MQYLLSVSGSVSESMTVSDLEIAFASPSFASFLLGWWPGPRACYLFSYFQTNILNKFPVWASWSIFYFHICKKNIFLTSFLFGQDGRGRGPAKATAAARSSVYRQPGLFGYICIFPHLYIFVNTLGIFVFICVYLWMNKLVYLSSFVIYKFAHRIHLYIF